MHQPVPFLHPIFRHLLAALCLTSMMVPCGAQTAKPATDHPTSEEVLLLTYFKANGQFGPSIAQSTDGINFTPLNNGEPFFQPPKSPEWKGQKLVRDASVLYRDGLFHMVWTSGWGGRVFGYASSKDLVHWSEPKKVTPFPSSLPGEDQPQNVWAPELHWDPAKQDYFILFSSTTQRERSNDNASNNDGKVGSKYDNRVYITRTKDFQTYSEPKVFYPCDFASIDAVMRLDEPNNRWAMIIKCSRNWNLPKMPGRNLWVTFTGLDLDHPDFTPLQGPIAGNHSPMYSNADPKKSMAEGPSLIKYHDHWLLVWDEPAGDGLQLATSDDLLKWTHHKEATLPREVFHGTLFYAPKSAVGWLK